MFIGLELMERGCRGLLCKQPTRGVNRELRNGILRRLPPHENMVIVDRCGCLFGAGDQCNGGDRVDKDLAAVSNLE